MTISLDQFEAFMAKLEANAPVLAITVTLQVLFGFLWYGVIFMNPYLRYTSIDKGVKRMEYAIRRYSFVTCWIVTIATSIGRTLLAVILTDAVASSNCGCKETFVAAVLYLAWASQAMNDFWAQRPLALQLIHHGCQIAMCGIAAFAPAHIKNSPVLNSWKYFG